MSMDSPAISVKNLLVAANLGVFASVLDSEWNISVGQFPLAPDTSIVCTDTGGLPPSPNLLLNFPSVQVRVRAAPGDYPAASSKVRAIVDALLGIPAQDLTGGDHLDGITQIGDVGFLGYDEVNRPIFTSNFSLIVEPKVGGYRHAIA